jgi:hypothetical protein
MTTSNRPGPGGAAAGTTEMTVPLGDLAEARSEAQQSAESC